MSERAAWAILNNYYDIDGKLYRSLQGYGAFSWERPRHFGGYTTATFATREEARAIARQFNEERKKWLTPLSSRKSRYVPVHVTVQINQDPLP